MVCCLRRWVVAGEVIRYGNHPASIREYLLGAVGVPVVVAGVPKQRPKSFVVLEPSGGSDSSVVHGWRSMIVDSWAESQGDAFDLALDVEAHLRALRNERIRGVLIYKARPLGGIVWMPDPDAKVPRFRQNFEFLTRGEVI